MAVSKVMVRAVLSRCALLFDAPKVALENWDDAVDCWVRLMPETMTDEAFSSAASVLVRTLTRWPVPADFLAQAEPATEAQVAHA